VTDFNAAAIQQDSNCQPCVLSDAYIDSGIPPLEMCLACYCESDFLPKKIFRPLSTATFLKPCLNRPIFDERLSLVCSMNRARYRFCRFASVLSEPVLANVRNVAVWAD
jgi:hypothetical protein